MREAGSLVWSVLVLLFRSRVSLGAYGRRGLTMESVSLTKQADADDDLLEIRFGLADPAISKLKAG
jgi:hypothetical protein